MISGIPGTLRARSATLMLFAVGLFLPQTTLSSPQDAAPQEAVPDGVQQIIPRGTIPAVFDPEFVSPEKAWIPDDAWVLGVVVNGEAHAYSLNLLNHHEVVNDVIGGRAVASVW